jgi:hypothetical protein
MDWQETSNNWVLIPPQPVGLVHFLGGAFVATAPHLLYRSLLEALAQAGYGIIATPFFALETLDHQAIARNVLNRFETACDRLIRQQQLPPHLPIYGIGHSMGCKLHLLINSRYPVERVGNALISFNNFPIDRSIPFADRLQLRTSFNLDFTPTPAETLAVIKTDYPVQRNLLIKFRRDDIDQTYDLAPIFETRFATQTRFQILPGTHTTPLSQRLNWQVGKAFTPLDAIGQWVKQEVSRDLDRLQQELLHWLRE